MKKSIYIVTLISLFFSCEEILEVTDISSEQVIILAPQDNAVIENGVVNFSWNQVNEANSYRLQIATPDFANAVQIIEDTLVANTNFSKTMANGDYQWRVKARNEEYSTGYNTKSFSIID